MSCVGSVGLRLCEEAKGELEVSGEISCSGEAKIRKRYLWSIPLAGGWGGGCQVRRA